MALLAACGDATPAQSRNRALLAVLYRAGLRLGEALALEPKDIDPGAGSIRVLRGKGGRDRVVGIDPGGAEILAAWLRRREAVGHGPTGPVFCSASGRPVTQAYVRRLLPRLAHARWAWIKPGVCGSTGRGPGGRELTPRMTSSRLP